MRMSAGVRKLALTLHVSSSVGWVGAVMGFLALAIAGLLSPDETTVRAAYVAMNLVASGVVLFIILHLLKGGAGH